MSGAGGDVFDELAQVPPDRTVSDLPEPPKGAAVEAGQQLNLVDASMEEDIDLQTRAAAFADDPAAMPAPEPVPVTTGGGTTLDGGAAATTAAAQAALGDMMGDAPLCDTCGHITVRNGSCYKCLNCGNSLGCS